MRVRDGESGRFVDLPRPVDGSSSRTINGGSVATSRRRERELARRRYERRRLREMERRAKARRRNTILGATLGTIGVIAAIVVLAVVLSGGGDDKTNATSKLTPTPTASTSPTPPPVAPTKCATIKPNPPAKGQAKVPDVTGK